MRQLQTASTNVITDGTSSTVMPARIPVYAAMPPIIDGVITEPKVLTVTKIPIARGYSPKTLPALATVVPYIPERDNPRPIVPTSIKTRFVLISRMHRNTTMPAQRIRIIRGGTIRADRTLHPNLPAKMVIQSRDVKS